MRRWHGERRRHSDKEASGSLKAGIDARTYPEMSAHASTLWQAQDKLGSELVRKCGDWAEAPRTPPIGSGPRFARNDINSQALRFGAMGNLKSLGDDCAVP